MQCYLYLDSIPFADQTFVPFFSSNFGPYAGELNDEAKKFYTATNDHSGRL